MSSVAKPERAGLNSPLVRLPVTALRTVWTLVQAPERYWQERVHLAVKAALAAVLAWTIARHGLGHGDPYYAPLAALLAVYPTVARSLAEGLRYAAGFVAGTLIAIPIGLWLGPNLAGIGAVVLFGLAVGSWRRLGDQSAQIAFVALYVVLFGAREPITYVTPRAMDLAIGVGVGLLLNLAVFPPMLINAAVLAQRRVGEELAGMIDWLTDAVRNDTPPLAASLRFREQRLGDVDAQARAATRRAFEGLRWNPRARVHRSAPRPAAHALDSLEYIGGRLRSIARTLLDTLGQEELPTAFHHGYAELLSAIAPLVRAYADPNEPDPDADAIEPARERLRDLKVEAPPDPTAQDAWDAQGDLLTNANRVLRRLEGGQP